MKKIQRKKFSRFFWIFFWIYHYYSIGASPYMPLAPPKKRRTAACACLKFSERRLRPPKIFPTPPAPVKKKRPLRLPKKKKNRAPPAPAWMPALSMFVDSTWCCEQCTDPDWTLSWLHCSGVGGPENGSAPPSAAPFSLNHFIFRGQARMNYQSRSWNLTAKLRDIRAPSLSFRFDVTYILWYFVNPTGFPKSTPFSSIAFIYNTVGNSGNPDESFGTESASWRWTRNRIAHDKAAPKAMEIFWVSSFTLRRLRKRCSMSRNAKIF